MHHFKSIILLVVIGSVFYSCCVSSDCNSENPYGVFRIIKNNDGTDLVFGSNKIYDKKEIKFYSVILNDTTFFDCQPFLNSGSDSAFFVLLRPKPDVVYIKLSEAEVDTLEFSYTTHSSKCCGAITEIAGFRLNNTTDVELVNRVMEIRK
jgi:hypothetical protein